MKFTIKSIERKEAIYTVALLCEDEQNTQPIELSVDVAPLDMNSAEEIVTSLAYIAKSALGGDGTIESGAPSPYALPEGISNVSFEVGDIFLIL